MPINTSFPLTLIAVAILSGCSAAPKNSSLADAHNRYDNAQANQQITRLAAAELSVAGDSIRKADTALSKGESDETVNHLAYLASQQVGIAQETANRKESELVVANATAKRNQELLAARTIEADTAKRQVIIAQATADWQSEELAAASANAVSDMLTIDKQKAQLEASSIEADTVKRQVVIAKETTDRQAEELVAASANAASDQVIIAQQEKQLQALNAKRTERGLVVTLGDVLFASNRVQLKSGGTRNVQKLADFLSQYPNYKILIEGYTDSTGSDDHNQDLSDRRANAVRAALINLGINGNRIATRGYGKEFPVASNDTAVSRQLNRRVEIIFSNDNGIIATR
jgi:outer membrane protein OmpA-like peptidoglycan-associated protein